MCEAPLPEDDLLPISALQHLLFCERQAALIHVERLWAENDLTAQGRQLHQRPDEGRREMLRGRQKGVRVERSVPLRSFRLGVWGVADVVEFPAGFPGEPPRPVEYKRGRPKRDGSDAVQLCAQAICLEEMLGVSIPSAFLFYGQTRHRQEVRLDADLRLRTAQAARRMHELLRTGHTPPAALQRKCARCSMLNLCQPKAIGRRPGQSRSAASMSNRLLSASLASEVAGEDTL